jgi:hypothetical protein
MAQHICDHRVGRRARRRLAGDRRGAMLAFVAVTMVGLFGFMALTLDLGSGNRNRRVAQAAADAGAMGGAWEIFRLQSSDTVIASSQNEAVRNFAARDSLSVFYPPATGPHAGDLMYVEVLVYKRVPSIFGKLLSFSDMNVRARAVAGVGSYTLNCIISLEPTAPSAIEVENGGEIDTNCGIAINSSSPNALDVNQSGNIDTGGQSIGITGGWTGNKTPVPEPGTGVTPTVNPLAGITMPTVPPCTTTGLLTITTDTVLSPGTYCGGIDISTKQATLQPGTYFISGGGINIANGGTIIGTGVTLISTPNGSYGPPVFYFGQGCKMKLSAPIGTGDPWKGILMYGDPAGGSLTHTFACSSDDDPELTGALYFPTQSVYFIGSNSGTTVQGTVIAASVQVKGKLNVISDTSGNTATLRPSLVE